MNSLFTGAISPQTYINCEHRNAMYGNVFVAPLMTWCMRQAVIDDGVSKRLTLKKGPNVIRAAVVNGGGATDFCARILDASDKPIFPSLEKLDDQTVRFTLHGPNAMFLDQIGAALKAESFLKIVEAGR